MTYLEVEKPLADIAGKGEELRARPRKHGQMDDEKRAKAPDRKAGTRRR